MSSMMMAAAGPPEITGRSRAPGRLSAQTKRRMARVGRSSGPPCTSQRKRIEPSRRSCSFFTRRAGRARMVSSSADSRAAYFSRSRTIWMCHSLRPAVNKWTDEAPAPDRETASSRAGPSSLAGAAGRSGRPGQFTARMAMTMVRSAAARRSRVARRGMPV